MKSGDVRFVFPFINGKPRFGRGPFSTASITRCPCRCSVRTSSATRRPSLSPSPSRVTRRFRYQVYLERDAPWWMKASTTRFISASATILATSVVPSKKILKQIHVTHLYTMYRHMTCVFNPTLQTHDVASFAWRALSALRSMAIFSASNFVALTRQVQKEGLKRILL